MADVRDATELLLELWRIVRAGEDADSVGEDDDGDSGDDGDVSDDAASDDAASDDAPRHAVS